ncbi:MAG: hypothetical protein J7551_10710 [Chloroflexi bacterium]|nr:hypothetical protein [Chloroflexota bacterium]
MSEIGTVLSRAIFYTIHCLLSTLALLTLQVAAGYAQSDTGAICALAYHDANQNGVRDFGEEALPEVSYNLMVASNVLVANYVAWQGEPYCFENLPAQQYTLQVSSPLYVLDNGAITFVLQQGERVMQEFGARYRPPQVSALPQDALTVIPMTRSVRLGIAISAALIVMLLFSAFGMILYGLFLYRRPSLAAAGNVQRIGSGRIASERLKRSKQGVPSTEPRSERYRDLDASDQDA